MCCAVHALGSVLPCTSAPSFSLKMQTLIWMSMQSSLTSTCPCPCRLTSTKLQFPCHLYFLGTSKVCKYSLVTKATGAFAALPDTDAAGHSQQARHVLHSPKQNAWLVFFEGMEAPEPRSGASSSVGSGIAWRFTLVRDGMTDTATWFLPGGVMYNHICGST